MFRGAIAPLYLLLTSFIFNFNFIFMYKIILKVSTLILVNLFAFLLFWIILGAIFWNTKSFLLISIVVSIIPLTIIMIFEIQKTTKEFNNILPEKKDDWNSK